MKTQPQVQKEIEPDAGIAAQSHNELTPSRRRNKKKTIDMACERLKKDLEWYCTLPESRRSKEKLRNILAEGPSAGVAETLIEAWW